MLKSEYIYICGNLKNWKEIYKWKKGNFMFLLNLILANERIIGRILFIDFVSIWKVE
jgi:hypothetical protein